MTKPVLAIKRSLPKEVDARVIEDFLPRRAADGPPTTDELVALSDGASALLVSPTVQLNAGFFERIPASVRMVATMSVGYDHVDLTAKRKNIPGVPPPT